MVTNPVTNNEENEEKINSLVNVRKAARRTMNNLLFRREILTTGVI